MKIDIEKNTKCRTARERLKKGVGGLSQRE